MDDHLGNPAGRLYAFLEAFHEEADNSTSIRTAWANALTVTPADVPLRLAQISSLYLEVETAIRSDGRRQLTDTWDAYYVDWMAPVFFPDYNHGDLSHRVCDRGALVTLGTVATVLSQSSAEKASTRATRREALRGLRDSIETARLAVVGDEELPDKLRAVMLRRLHDMLWAIDNIDVFGEDGVVAAAERLTSRLIMEGPKVRDRFPTIKTVTLVLTQVFRVAAPWLGGDVDPTAGLAGLETLLNRPAIARGSDDGGGVTPES